MKTITFSVTDEDIAAGLEACLNPTSTAATECAFARALRRERPRAIVFGAAWHDGPARKGDADLVRGTKLPDDAILFIGAFDDKVADERQARLQESFGNTVVRAVPMPTAATFTIAVPA